MLHLEKWNFLYDEEAGWANWPNRLSRPKWLEDPTNDLIAILMKNYQKVRLLSL
jgi:hypothetical protein